MPLFGRKAKTEEKDKSATEVDKTEASKSQSKDSAVLQPVLNSFNPGSVILRPHVTEKAAIATDDGVYVFVVAEDANKHKVREAVKQTYKKTPQKVRIARKADKQVRRRGGMGVKKGLKKAYVYMKEGETLDIL
ncbi:MAG: 50S ribosomal protein L23 [Candidatus Campbellbacteria bacterium]|nr:50S ribosomal protein L23 [Candidatus Campbellbacteria bacterium]